VRLAWRWRGLSIYGRTFLLMLAALVVAEAVGMALVVNRPPTRDEPVRLADVARWPGAAPMEGPPGPPPDAFGRGPPPNGPPGPPPDGGVNGSWHSVEHVVEGFPTALQRRAALLFVLGAAALLPLAWLFARALSAPIRRFSEAAQRLGTDPNAPPLPREGPAEMLVAVDSFNSMQARLSRLIRERTHMVGAIAHDLRTPLTRLAFRLDDLPPPLREKVDADIQEMKSMISAALDFIRDRALTGQQERLDFRLLVESVVDNQGDLGHDVTLHPGEPLTIGGNPLALRRMVVNLVENALKYGERARLRLRAAGGRCVLEVDDDGPGIPEQLQDQVFEPFFRLESSRNRDTGGIGLGLATVRAVVLEHGGEIALGNRKGGGLRVTISLPVIKG
jgi:two-component system OmpR family sensor kinase